MQLPWHAWLMGDRKRESATCASSAGALPRPLRTEPKTCFEASKSLTEIGLYKLLQLQYSSAKYPPNSKSANQKRKAPCLEVVTLSCGEELPSRVREVTTSTVLEETPRSPRSRLNVSHQSTASSLQTPLITVNRRCGGGKVQSKRREHFSWCCKEAG